MLYTFEKLIDGKHNFNLGKKAESLLELSRIGINVPDGAVISEAALKKYLVFNQIDQYIAQFHKIKNTSTDIYKQHAASIREKIISGKFPNDIIVEISNYVQKHPKTRFVVRSSSNNEDLIFFSFAGLYDTVLNLKDIYSILEGIKICWASLFNERVIEYCLAKSISLKNVSMSLILQQMIPAEKSGVIFTVNPVTGIDREMVIEACIGLGEALVSGVITPDQYYFDWFKGKLNSKSIHQQKIAIIAIDQPPFTKTTELSKLQQSAAVLEESELEMLVEQALKVQVSYGFPVDLEWVKYDEQFYFVQSRPITIINYRGIEGEWTTANWRDGGVSSNVCSAFMWSLYKYVWEVVMPAYVKEINALPNYDVSQWGEVFFGRPYWNVGDAKNGLKKLPGFVERNFDEDLGIQIFYDGNGRITPTNIKTIFEGIKILLAIQANFKRTMKTWQPFRQKQIEYLDELGKIDLTTIRWEEFIRLYRTLIQENYFWNESTYFRQIFSTSMAATLFKDSLKKVNTDINFLDLVSGLSNVFHLELNYNIWDISQKVLENKEAKQFWSETSVDELVECWRNKKENYLMDEVITLVQRFAHKSIKELDLTIPRFDEDPKFLIKSIKDSLNIDSTINPRELSKRQENNFVSQFKAFKKSLPFYKSPLLISSLDRLRKFLWWREELRNLSIHYYYYIRKFTLHLVPYLQEQNIIDNKGDIFHLSKDSILEVLFGQMSNAEARALLEKNKAYYQSFRNFNNPGEISNKYNNRNRELTNISYVTDSNFVLHGIPCSPGKAVGKIKFIKDLSDAERLAKGDILITKFTDPGWTSKFGLLAAIATETGGILSHAAVISREYGIPAVLSVKGLTEKLSEGQRVLINGDLGTIEALK